MDILIYGYAIYYPHKYFRLMWELDSIDEMEFRRYDVNIGVMSNSKKDLYYGYRRNFRDYEVELFLYKNKGLKGQPLLNARPNPEMLLIAKGDDPGNYLTFVAKKIRAIKDVNSVIPLKMNKVLKIRELIYS